MPRHRPPLEDAAGFGNCAECAFRENGPVSLCFACARESMEAPRTDRCEICDLPLKEGTRCGNPICGWGDRQFERNYAIAMRSGVLEDAINRYKYGGKVGWAVIFGRVLAGFLESRRDVFAGFDLIVASPTFVAPGGPGRDWDHTRLVLQKCAEETDLPWPFDLEDPAAIIKRGPTRRMQGMTWRDRKAESEGALHKTLEVPDAERTRGRRILVYDDVFTCGFTLNEVARCLREAGKATSVSGVTLARQKWKGDK